MTGSTQVWGIWGRAGRLTGSPLWGIRMGLDERRLPLTRGQLDIWLAQKTGSFGAKWQLGELVRIEGTVEPDLLERSIVQAVREAEPLRAAFFEVDGQVFQQTG